MPEKIAFIGAGIMGKPMILNLLKAGYPVSVYVRRPERAPSIVQQGAVLCPTPRAAAAQADVCIVMVADTPDVEEVTVHGTNSIIKGIKQHSLVVDMSTISAVATRTLAETFAEQGVHFLDAPVSGGEKGAIEGTLSIMVGGTTTAFQRALPLFEVLGENIVHVGPSGAGQIAKACNQLVVAQTMLAVAEAFELARKAGVDPKQVRQALLGGFAYSRILEHHGKKMLESDYAPGFKARLHLKDLRNTQAVTRQLNLNLAGLALTHDYLEKLIALGDGELDSLAIQKIVQAHKH